MLLKLCDSDGGATPRVLGCELPPPPPPSTPYGASGQQIVAKGAALGSPQAPKVHKASWPSKPPKGNLVLFAPPYYK